MAIDKPIGQTPTEQYLAQLCDRTFLNLWSYANPFKADGKELCDLIAIFENNVFLFFDRESRKFDSGGDVAVTWERWKKEAITKQVRTAAGAKRYLLSNRDHIYLDASRTQRLPLSIPPGELLVHKIVVAHGAKDACQRSSASNIYGSLGISYGDHPSNDFPPFIVSLPRSDPTHLLDSHNLELIFGELDTIYDFKSYFVEKERAIQRYTALSYCGEEDLLAHYFLNFDEAARQYKIGLTDGDYNALMIGEGEWRDFIELGPYRRRKSENQVSYLWDRLIQKTGQNALSGVLQGNADVFRGKSAIHEMAKEPRLSRRAISQIMATAIKNFPDNARGIVRHLSFMPSFFPDVGYVFLQLFHDSPGDYDTEYRPQRRRLLECCCGAAKLRWPELSRIIGIAIDAPKYSTHNSEDFILFECDNWTEADQAYYEPISAELQLFRTSGLKERRLHVSDFPSASRTSVPDIGRNQLCPCGSGKKFKRCHGRRD